ncbi:hypothetical protein EV424DRAFT_1342941 [Suillus variegatus]|nr:hypothetical protein EV424DRAFT_1342941 [Suillus variegatus]
MLGNLEDRYIRLEELRITGCTLLAMTPNDVIQHVTGLQFSRFEGVVGMLWEVEDAVAKHVFVREYVQGLRGWSCHGLNKAAWGLEHGTCSKKKMLGKRIVFIGIVYINFKLKPFHHENTATSSSVRVLQILLHLNATSTKHSLSNSPEIEAQLIHQLAYAEILIHQVGRFVNGRGAMSNFHRTRANCAT